ncbi:MAG: Dam family site-specific DNA-(adenine-N6)-methyltransferase [Ruminococcus sp.]|nr:Dam family site-specific DNA-(adenine-N6)-methyltransferase [Ruminococcus sp.]
MTANDAAEKWGISRRRVITLCNESRIPDVAMLGNMWIIPIEAVKPVDGRTTRYEKRAAAKPFVKWAGGKGKLLTELRKFYPPKLGTEIRKYCEPMVGAGAVLFDILNTYEMDEVMICDSNEELINTFAVIRDNVDNLIDVLSDLEHEHLRKDDDGRREYYYEKRELFNELIKKPAKANSLQRAALFIYLNRTCFNGLYRVNRQGLFNVPVGAYKKPLICDEDNLRTVSDKIQDVQLVTGDYKQVNDFVDENTFVYFDPPYRPLSKTSDFTAYNVDGFGDKEQIELAEFIKELAARGVKVLASNSDPKNVDEEDNFFDDLYSPLNIYRVHASRAINSKGKGRGKISELVISGF